MITASGFLFDGTKDDPTFSSSDIIEAFVDKFESIHKLNLPMPNHVGTDYRRVFLKIQVSILMKTMHFFLMLYASLSILMLVIWI